MARPEPGGRLTLSGLPRDRAARYRAIAGQMIDLDELGPAAVAEAILAACEGRSAG